MTLRIWDMMTKRGATYVAVLSLSAQRGNQVTGMLPYRVSSGMDRCEDLKRGARYEHRILCCQIPIKIVKNRSETSR
jgi:hypothetical protein